MFKEYMKANLLAYISVIDRNSYYKEEYSRIRCFSPDLSEYYEYKNKCIMDKYKLIDDEDLVEMIENIIINNKKDKIDEVEIIEILNEDLGLTLINRAEKILRSPTEYIFKNIEYYMDSWDATFWYFKKKEIKC